jgi:hypothetical protein
MSGLSMPDDIVPRSANADREPYGSVVGLATTDELGPISPELALVDPELARAARARVPSELRSGNAHVPPYRPASVGSVTITTARAGVSTAPRADGRVGPRRRRSWRRRIGVGAVVVVAGAAGLGLSTRLSSEQVAQRQRVGAPSEIQPPTVGPHDAKKTVRHDETRDRTTGRASSVHTRSGAERHAAKPRITEKAPVPFVPPTRVFIWAGVKGASYYKVEFFRRGRRVFAASPSAPRLTLPLRWRYDGREMQLQRGVYAWRVSPAFGTRLHARLGRPVVRSTWIARA